MDTLFDVIPESNDVITTRAIKKAGDNADPTWFKEALDAVKHCALTLGEFTTDDVWEVLTNRNIDATREPRALGAVIRNAKSLKLIVPTGNYRRSNRPECHMNPKMIWRATGVRP